MKSIFLVEGRRRLRNDRYIPNKTEHIVGAFNSLGNAKKWIKSHGTEFYPINFKSLKHHFFAILECPVSKDFNTYEGGFLAAIYTKDGIQIR